jgi:hypothetical protein
MTNYNDLNIFEKANLAKDLNMDTVEQVAAMINSKATNRSQRRRLEKSLKRVNTIYNHVQNRVDRSAYTQYQKAVDKNFLHFYSILALTMKEDYHWREDETHDQISSLLERVDKKINKYAEKNFTTEDLVKLVNETCDIQLISDNH